jgi:hypothetical protein
MSRSNGDRWSRRPSIAEKMTVKMMPDTTITANTPTASTGPPTAYPAEPPAAQQQAVATMFHALRQRLSSSGAVAVRRVMVSGIL